MEENNNNWYNTNEPFNLEVEIIDDSMRKSLEDLILRSAVKGTEFLPGLRINKAYKQSLDKHDILSAAMKDEFDELMRTTQSAFYAFFKKWSNDEHPELTAASFIEHPVNFSSNEPLPDDMFSGWAPVENCYKNCKRCQAKCLYRKESYVND